MAFFRHSHFTLLILAGLLFPSLAFCIDVTTLLSSFPDLSDFSRLLSDSAVPADLTHRSSITLLAVPNSFLQSALASDDLNHWPSTLTDVLRYHVLLQYLSWPDLREIPPSGKLVTTLFQTTGRAHSDLGALNVTLNSRANITFRSLSPSPSSNATLLSLVKTLPYNISIFTVDSLLLPYGFGLAASEDAPKARLNITRILSDAKNFNVAAGMLLASGVVEEFEDDEHGAGITIFAPTDDAFSYLPPAENLQSLSANTKSVVLKFHVLHSYYPLGSLESIVNPVQPTLATEDMGAGRYTLNITRVNGSVAIDTGIVQAEITQTVFDQNPVAVFAVSRVLLPREVFGRENERMGLAVPPEIGLPPENSIQNPPAHLETPPGSRGDVRSTGGNGEKMGSLLPLFCIALYVLV
ncbi:fasciclin-like arabinogalactan protein 4 [Aristolochia californica]|uniref:fasciclin-like arabinogalactan protein 4 n=1 Tax=Aristolochia californica TaxID=171875 RepID=UPI0035D5632B